MNDAFQVTPSAAADSLRAAAQAPSPGKPRDRRVYAVGTAVFGLVLGCYVGLTRALATQGGVLNGLLTAGYVALMLGTVFWQRRAGTAIPLGAKRIGYTGLAVCVLLVIVGTMWVNWSYRDNAVPTLTAAGLGLAVGAPLIVAAWLIARMRDDG